MILFLNGAIMMACGACGVFFFKFWQNGRDRFFLIFAFAFWALAVERLMLVILDPNQELRYYVYLIRLLAFFLISAAVVDKNVKGGR